MNIENLTNRIAHARGLLKLLQQDSVWSIPFYNTPKGWNTSKGHHQVLQQPFNTH